jgi:DNA-binding NarL/FixJ family response regulator
MAEQGVLATMKESARTIAASLTISPRTVNRHVCNIFGTLVVPSRAAAAHAVGKGLI